MKKLWLMAAVLLIVSPRSAGAQPPADHPQVLLSTYWGGSSQEEIEATFVDQAGNLYVAGTTSSPNFPRTVSTLPALGGQEVFVSKFDASGHLVFSTVFGGSTTERVGGIAVDGAGNIIVVGDTFSSDLLMVNPIQPSYHGGICGEFGGTCPDGFIAKLDPTGSAMIYSSYLGGGFRFDNAFDVAVDAAGNAYVVGMTESATFEGASPVRPYSGGQDAFIAKIPPAGGSFAYFTYLGGGSQDTGNGIAVDGAGNAYVTGVAGSSSFPVLNPIQAAPENFSSSAFVTKLDGTGAIAYSTFLGGHSSDAGFDIAVTATGEAVVAGITGSTNFPTVNAQQPFLRGLNDVFVAKLTAAGSSLVYSTYLGGNDREQVIIDFAQAAQVAVDGGGNAYVSGTTQSVDFPAVLALQPFGGSICSLFVFQSGPCPDAFLSKFDSQGKLTFSTSIGGGNDDRGRAVAVSGDGIAYVAGVTKSTNFPLHQPLQTELSGLTDAFITKISTAPLACQLALPVQLSPLGGIFDPLPTFSWLPVPGAAAYVVLIKGVAESILTGTPSHFVLGATADTSLASPGPLPPGDFEWLVVPWNATCGLGRPSAGMTFTLPGSCPVGQAVNLTPSAGAVVPNPTRFEWTVNGPSPSLSVLVLLNPNGSLVALYPAASNTLTVGTTLATGNYFWFVLTWNSTCGFTASELQTFRSTGTVVP